MNDAHDQHAINQFHDDGNPNHHDEEPKEEPRNWYDYQIDGLGQEDDFFTVYTS